MSSSSWARIKPVLDQALSVSPSERAAVIRLACAEDEILRREVEQYLSYEACAPALLPATEWRSQMPADDEPPPERVGPWKILRELGSGGMGIVYLAERDDGEYRQTAALKLMRDSHRSEAFVELFRRERQTLAQLNHPNIARLLDGGTTPAGWPYCVMEYVEGEPLNAYCLRLNLPVEARLRLILDVCRAVSHAHHNLFIHRDIKPGNILVTAAGEPKLLDFGLAKLLDPGTPSEVTISWMPLFTPAYASPEQMRGEHLTTASDVYSIGVILYELLAGCSPYKADGQNFGEMWTAVCERTPDAPSTSAAHDGRRTRISADLDSIVLMCLRKEPERRYASADALGEDLERYLDGKPVRARQGNAAYHLRRFVARHKWAVMGFAAAFVGVSVSLGFVLWEQQKAALRFQQLRRFANSVVFELHDSIEPLPGSTPARKLLVQRSLEYLRSLETSSGRDLSLKWELAEAYKRIGDAQGDPARANLGDSAGALDSYGRARGLLHQIIAADTGQLPVYKTLAAIDVTSAGVLEEQGKLAEALALRRDAASALRQITLRGPTLAARKALALSHYHLATGLNQTQDWPAATREWQETLRLYRDIARSDPGNRTFARNVALCEKRLAASYLRQDEYPEASEHYLAAEQIDRARLTAEPQSPEAKMDLSFDLSDLGLTMYRQRRFPEAIVNYEGALALRREVLAADPHDYRAQVTVGRSLDRLADAYESAGQLERAIQASLQATSTFATVQRLDPTNLETLKETGLAIAHLARYYRSRATGKNRTAAATDWFAASVALERASALFTKLNSSVPLTQDERATILSIPAALEDSRKMLAQLPSGRR